MDRDDHQSTDAAHCRVLQCGQRCTTIVVGVECTIHDDHMRAHMSAVFKRRSWSFHVSQTRAIDERTRSNHHLMPRSTQLSMDIVCFFFCVGVLEITLLFAFFGTEREYLHTCSANSANDENDEHVFPPLTNRFTRCWSRDVVQIVSLSLQSGTPRSCNTAKMAHVMHFLLRSAVCSPHGTK